LEGSEKAVRQMLDETNAVRQNGMPRPVIAGEAHGNDRLTARLPVGKPPDFFGTPKLL